MCGCTPRWQVIVDGKVVRFVSYWIARRFADQYGVKVTKVTRW